MGFLKVRVLASFKMIETLVFSAYLELILVQGRPQFKKENSKLRRSYILIEIYVIISTSYRIATFITILNYFTLMV